MARNTPFTRTRSPWTKFHLPPGLARSGHGVFVVHDGTVGYLAHSCPGDSRSGAVSRE